VTSEVLIKTGVTAVAAAVALVAAVGVIPAGVMGGAPAVPMTTATSI
jgi:hypothetical protein